MPHYLPKDERILFFEVFIIFFYFLQNLKRRSGGRGWSWCMPLSRRALGQSALRLSWPICSSKHARSALGQGALRISDTSVAHLDLVRYGYVCCGHLCPGPHIAVAHHHHAPPPCAPRLWQLAVGHLWAVRHAYFTCGAPLARAPRMCGLPIAVFLVVQQAL